MPIRPVLAQQGPDVVQREFAGRSWCSALVRSIFLRDAAGAVLIINCSSLKPKSTAATPGDRRQHCIRGAANPKALVLPAPLTPARRTIIFIAMEKIFMDLEDWSSRLKVFADATRVRLLALLEARS